MNSVISLPAKTLLAVKSPSDLYPNDEAQAKLLFQRLSSKWHPDKASGEPQAVEVFQHVKSLYEKAVEQIKAGIWGGLHSVKFELKDSIIEASYLRKDEVLGFGDVYVGKRNVYYKTSKDNSDLVSLWRANISSLEVGSKLKPGSEKVFESTLKAVPNQYMLEGVDSGILVRVEKPAGYFCLKHVLEKAQIGPGVPSGLDPKHVAWILSRLYNLACLMQLSNVANIGISTSSVYISPVAHDVALLDGWQYASKFDSKAFAAPVKTLKHCPTLADTGIVNPSHVLALIKAVGRECLGDPIGVNLQKRKDVPSSVTKWLNSPAGDNCYKEFAKWSKARDDGFGPRKFVEWNLKESDVY